MKSKKFTINSITKNEKNKSIEKIQQPSEPVKEEEKPIPFFKLFRYATGLDKILLLIGGIASILSGIVQPINMLLFGDLTGHIINYAYVIQNITSQEAFDEATDTFISEISSFAIYNSLLGLGMFIFSYFATVLYNYSALRQIFKIRSLYLEKALNQDIAWYDINQTGDFASRMSDDLSKVEDGIGEKVSMFINLQVAFISSLILALVKGWELALICLTSLPVIMICLGIVAFITSKVAKKEVDAYAEAGSIAEEVFSAIRTVVSFGGQDKEIQRYKEKLVFACKNNIKRTFLSGAGFGLLWFFIYGSYALAFWYGVKLVLEEKDLPEDEKVYGPGNMVTVFFSVMSGSMNFGMATPYIEAFGLAQGAAARIFNVIDNIPVINKSKNSGEQLPKIDGNISFKDVKFHYPSRPDIEILQGLTLNIEAGETVALVGSSGCGKSTCLQLVQRFYDPGSGSVYLDGKNLKDLDLTWLRNNIGVVGQEPILFGTTIAENIRYGYTSATQEDIEKAAIKANAHHFIKLLPQGYNTLVGERGAQLSGGQKQRIAIARALVRNPAILLLDEATSALDTNSEAKVQAALDAASKGCTTIIVAHRLSTIRNANKIVVISNGKVVEQGTHNELMALKQEYFSLVTTQVSSDDTLQNSEENKNENLVEFDDGKRTSIVPDEIDMGGYEEERGNNNSDVSLWVIMKMNSPEWIPIVIGCLSSVVMGAAMPVFAILFGEILGVLANDDEDYVRSETNMYCVYFVIAGIISGLSTFLMMYMFGIAGEKLTMRVRIEMFQTMLKQEMGWFDNKENGVGALCAKLSVDAAHVQGATGQRIGTILQSLSTLFLAVGLSMYYEWRLGLVALAFTPFILLATFLQQRLMNVESQTQHKSLQKSTKIAVEAVTNVRTVASLGSEELFHKLYMTELLPHHKMSLRNTHSRAIVYALARSLMFFAFSACMYYGGILISEGLGYSNVFKVSQSLIMGTVSIANALAFAPNFHKGLKAAGNMLTLLNRQSKIQDSVHSKDKFWDKSNIKYSQIYFSYPSRPNTTVLKNMNLSIFHGKTVALVGPSGCGKSTMIQLIERFYDPNSGEVSIDGENLQLITLKSLRSQLGIVSQEPNLFDRTIAENIAYGDNSRKVPMDEIIQAAKSANIHNFVSSLPSGYDTRLGEKGTQLSGGQKQRVAIARALVRNPKVLLLDEATSALDIESEKVVQEALDNAKVGRTCIIIAHRLSTIQDADVICVINKGKVAEMGTHSELISKKGLYYRLHSLQTQK